MDVQPIDIQTFLIGALAIAKEQGFLWTDVADPNDEYLYRLYKRWGGEKELKQHKDVDRALMDFRAKLMSGKNRAEERMKEQVRQIAVDRLEVSLHIPMGKDRTVDFTASGVIPLDATQAEKKYYYGTLWRSVYQGWVEFKENPPQELLPQKPQYQTEIDPALSQFEFTSISLEIKGGERYYKVVGSQFPKHGVIVYPEVLYRAGIQAHKIEGSYTCYGIAGYTKKQDGKPEKVVYMQVQAGDDA